MYNNRAQACPDSIIETVNLLNLPIGLCGCSYVVHYLHKFEIMSFVSLRLSGLSCVYAFVFVSSCVKFVFEHYVIATKVEEIRKMKLWKPPASLYNDTLRTAIQTVTLPHTHTLGGNDHEATRPLTTKEQKVLLFSHRPLHWAFPFKCMLFSPPDGRAPSWICSSAKKNFSFRSILLPSSRCCLLTHS